MSDRLVQVDKFLARCLRTGDFNWAIGSEHSIENEVVTRIGFHGISGLILAKAEHPLEEYGWPSSVSQAVQLSTQKLAMWELGHLQFLRQCLHIFDELSTNPIFFKGTSIAYSLYSEPYLRMRADSDALIPEERLSEITEAFLANDFRYQQEPGELIFRQGNIMPSSEKGEDNTIDLHSRFNNSPVIAKLFSYDELLDHSRLLPSLSNSARGVDPVTELAITCIHRTVHITTPYYVNGIAYYSADRLIWFSDISLLCNSFHNHQWDQFLDMVIDKQVANLCWAGLDSAREKLGAEIPEEVASELQQIAKAKIEIYLEGGDFKRNWMDLLAQDSFSNQLKFLKQTFFPPAEYMYEIYPHARIQWLPWLHLRRILAGVWSRFSGLFVR